MSFYHILPSNTSPNYFPKNNASQYSTPVDNPYDLSGSWELALMNMTYTNCVKTFNNDTMVVKETCSVSKFIYKTTKCVKVPLSLPKKGTPLDIIYNISREINTKFKGILSVTVSNDKKYYTWKFQENKGFIILSQTLQKAVFNLWSDVLTAYDLDSQNYHPVGGFALPTNADDLFIIWLPSSYKNQKIVVKKEHTTIKAEALVEYFNALVPNTIASLFLEKGNNHFKTIKCHNDKNVIIFSKEFLKALNVRHGGQFRKGMQQFLEYDFHDAFKSEWSVSIYYLDEIIPYSPTFSREIVLTPVSFKKQSNAISFINKQINDDRIVFSINKSNYMELTITDKALTLTFSNTLSDIFAFDKISYTGVGKYSASDTFSLSRRIQYLFIYSNISEYIRIGDTEAPLLAVVPFNAGESCQLLTEKVFKMPMYVRLLANHISQIDIGIYDGSGQLVPFLDDSVTTLRLHFQQTT